VVAIKTVTTITPALAISVTFKQVFVPTHLLDNAVPQASHSVPSRLPTVSDAYATVDVIVIKTVTTVTPARLIFAIRRQAFVSILLFEEANAVPQSSLSAPPISRTVSTAFARPPVPVTQTARTIIPVPMISATPRQAAAPTQRQANAVPQANWPVLEQANVSIVNAAVRQTVNVQTIILVPKIAASTEPVRTMP
jgi:hypothetical protein